MIRKALFPLAIIFIAILMLVACAPKEKTPGSASPAATPAQSAPASGQVLLELFVMSQCPYGKGAEGVIGKVAEALPGTVKVEIGFILDEIEGPDKFKSLHGPSEVVSDRVQACIGLVHPEKLMKYITTSNETSDPWQKVASGLSLDVGAVEKCTTDGRGDDVLKKDAKRTKERNIVASPTLFINGSEYKGTISSLDLFEQLCKDLKDAAPAACKTPPADLSRSDGASAGHCGDSGDGPPVDPQMVDTTTFTHTIIYDAGAFSNNLDQVTGQTKKFFPNVVIEKLDYKDAKAKKLIDQYQIEWLPAFIFPKTIEQSKNFQRLSNVLIPIGKGPDAYQLDPQQLGANVALKRSIIPGTIQVLYTPYSMKSMTILMDIFDLLKQPEFAKYKDKITLLPAGRADRSGSLTAQFGPPEVEEMQRHEVILEMKDPEKFQKYLDVRRDNPMGTYWEDFIKKAGMSPDAVKAKALSKEIQAKVVANSKLATELGLQQEIGFLVNNRELALVRDKDDFRKLLEYAEKKK